MAYSPGSLRLIAGHEYEPDTPRIWSYRSTDARATVTAANYYADARLRGMQNGDYVFTTIVNGSNVPLTTFTSLVGSVGASGAVIGSGVLELTASGAVPAGVTSVELNHATVVIAATMVATEHPGVFVVKDTSATGTAAHTLTLTGGTFNGTNTIATLNARDEFLAVHFDSAGRGQIIVNVGSVALS